MVSLGLCYSTISPQYSAKDVAVGTHWTNNTVLYVKMHFSEKECHIGKNGKRQENITQVLDEDLQIPLTQLKHEAT